MSANRVKQGLIDNMHQYKWGNSMAEYIKDLIPFYVNMYEPNESKQQGPEQLSMHTYRRTKPNIYDFSSDHISRIKSRVSRRHALDKITPRA